MQFSREAVAVVIWSRRFSRGNQGVVVMIRFLSWLSAIFWISLGIIFMLRMQHMAEGLSFTTPDGLTGLRAIVSGLHIAIGTVILAFALNRLYLLGVFVSACAASGLAIVRLFGMAVDNAFTRSQIRDLIPEALGFFIAIAIVPRLRTELRLLGRASAEQPRKSEPEPL
jgi:hypothetical protein